MPRGCLAHAVVGFTLYDAQIVNLRLLPRLHLQMRNLEAQNDRIADYLVSGDTSRLSSPALPHPRQMRSRYRAPSEIGCARAAVLAALASIVCCFTVYTNWASTAFTLAPPQSTASGGRHTAASCRHLAKSQPNREMMRQPIYAMSPLQFLSGVYDGDLQL